MPPSFLRKKKKMEEEEEEEGASLRHDLWRSGKTKKGLPYPTANSAKTQKPNQGDSYGLFYIHEANQGKGHAQWPPLR